MEWKDRSRLNMLLRLAALIGIMFLMSDFAPAAPQARNHPDVSDLGATARQATIAIFRDRDSTAIYRFFSEPFVQHDPNIGDGLTGLRAFVTELANAPTTVGAIKVLWSCGAQLADNVYEVLYFSVHGYSLNSSRSLRIGRCTDQRFVHIACLVTNLHAKFFADRVMRSNERCHWGVTRRSEP